MPPKRLIEVVTLDELMRFVDYSGGVDSCWPWLGPTYKNGYGRIGSGKYESFGAHRKIYELAYGPTSLFICHECDNRICVNFVRHLKAATQKDNMEHCTKVDRIARGENNGFAWILDETVEYIRQEVSILRAQPTQRGDLCTLYRK